MVSNFRFSRWHIVIGCEVLISARRSPDVVVGDQRNDPNFGYLPNVPLFAV